jgi:PTH1 family peptidyl-tRNA hydrolase
MFPVKGRGRDLSVLRVGVGIGRPDSREKNAVADYVLSEMGGAEVGAVQRAVEPVLEILEEEFDWEGKA